MAKKQGELAGMESPSYPEIDAAAEHYVEQRDKRMKLTEKEKVAKDVLIAAMEKQGVQIYRDLTASPPLLVTILTKHNVAVEQQVAGPDEELDA